MNVKKIREQIPALTKRVHLNSAAVAPLFSETISEIQHFLDSRGTRATFDFSGWLEKIEACRENIAELVNASKEEIAFMLNTSQGINTVANMIEWEKGDTVITSDLEFPSNSIPWYNLRKKGVTVKTVKNVNGEIRIEDVEKMMDENTRMVAFSYVQFGNGFRCDLKEIKTLCNEYNAFLFTDAIQGLGAVTFNVKEMDIDFFSAAAYKWLMGPLGVGIFYIKKEHLERFDPPCIGWHSLKREEDQEKVGLESIEFADSARKFEPGGKSFALLMGLKKSLDILLDIGIDAIEKRVLNLSKYVLDNVEDTQTPSEEAKRAGIVNIPHPDAEKTAERLWEKNILVSPRMNGIRVSTHFWNTTRDVDALLEELQ